MEATFIRSLDDFRGDARLYHVSPPAKYGYESLTDDARDSLTDHVIVSAVDVIFTGPETYIFPANAAGEVLSWTEMGGSFRGDLDHAKALANAGYTLQPG